ncbi:hypothetical protein F4782DRAFT_253695 [Xylaria castorea]|nr:hypothetical protein F4782DRAFT_253695 [Xylaria castorea]
MSPSTCTALVFTSFLALMCNLFNLYFYVAGQLNTQIYQSSRIAWEKLWYVTRKGETIILSDLISRYRSAGLDCCAR